MNNFGLFVEFLDLLWEKKCSQQYRLPFQSPSNRNFSAKLVGRNYVWRIARKEPCESDSSYFVKFCNNTHHFTRELMGIKHIVDIASRHAEVLAPSLLYSDPDRHIIVTSPLGGNSCADLLRLSTRRMTASAEKYKELHAGFLNVPRWLALWQEETRNLIEQKCIPLYKHDHTTILERIRRKLPSLTLYSPSTASRIQNVIGKFELESQNGVQNSLVKFGTSVVVHGDFSPGNIFFHDGKIGVLDYEDLGIGPYFSDQFRLRYMLTQCRENWRYSPQLIQSLIDLLWKPVTLYEKSYFILSCLQWRLNEITACIDGHSTLSGIYRKYTLLKKVHRNIDVLQGML